MKSENDAAAHLALVYARTGETVEAIKLTEKLLIVPAELHSSHVTAMTQADPKSPTRVVYYVAYFSLVAK